MTRKSLNQSLATGCLIAVLLGAGFFAGRMGGPSIENEAYAAPSFLPDNSARGKSMSLTTGLIENGIEAVFGLDHLTGNLVCWILDPRTGQLATTYQTNVRTTMAMREEAEADFVMTTGFIDFSLRGPNGARPANTVVYVAEGNTGKVQAFAVMYDRSGAGELHLVSEMLIRQPNALRDQGN